MKSMTRLSLVASLALIFLLPLLFGQLMAASLIKLHLSTAAAFRLAVAIIVGGMINIPIKRIVRDEVRAAHPLAVYGFYGGRPELRRVRRETVIAVNLGGCLIPTGIALYELLHIWQAAPTGLVGVAIAAGVNVAVCYGLARLEPGVGILIPGLVPPFVAAAAALVVAPGYAAPVAFVAGVAGPLIGADLPHLREIEQSAVGIASIGGAGTFDGIVLSGIVAAYLA